MTEEAERCRAYLDACSAPKVQAVVEEQLLGRHLRSLLDMPGTGLVSLLDADAFDDLGRLYGLLRRPGVADGLKTLRDGMAAHLREKGRALVTSGGGGGGEAATPAEFVQRLLEEKDKYDTLIVRAFAGDKVRRSACQPGRSACQPGSPLTRAFPPRRFKTRLTARLSTSST